MDFLEMNKTSTFGFLYQNNLRILLINFVSFWNAGKIISDEHLW